MTSMADDINEQINAGRKTIAVASEDPDEMEPRRVPPAVIAAGVGAAVIGLGLLGWLIYRNRRRSNLIAQLRAALPSRAGDLRDRGVERLGDLRDMGMDRMSDVRSLSEEVRKRLKKAL
jgi:hypothetical protein